MTASADGGVEHVFVASNYHQLNEMIGFFRWLERKEKRFFVDRVDPIPDGTESFAACARYQPRMGRAVLYASRWEDLVKARLLTKFSRVRLVRLFHGAPQPSAWVFKERAPWDVVIACSRFEADLWCALAPEVRVAPVGWPKLESFAGSTAVAPGERPRIVIGSSWARDRCGLAHYPRLFSSAHAERVWLLHPNLSNPLAEQARLRVPEAELVALRRLAERSGVLVHDGKTSALTAMRGATLLFGAQSSTSLEWLIFDRPVVFLVRAAHLDFGAHIDELPAPLEDVIAVPERFERPEHRQRRATTQERLFSHLDGGGPARLDELVAELEAALVAS